MGFSDGFQRGMQMAMQKRQIGMQQQQNQFGNQMGQAQLALALAQMKQAIEESNLDRKSAMNVATYKAGEEQNLEETKNRNTIGRINLEHDLELERGQEELRNQEWLEGFKHDLSVALEETKLSHLTELEKQKAIYKVFTDYASPGRDVDLWNAVTGLAGAEVHPATIQQAIDQMQSNLGSLSFDQITDMLEGYSAQQEEATEDYENEFRIPYRIGYQPQPSEPGRAAGRKPSGTGGFAYKDGKDGKSPVPGINAGVNFMDRWNAAMKSRPSLASVMAQIRQVQENPEVKGNISPTEMYTVAASNYLDSTDPDKVIEEAREELRKKIIANDTDQAKFDKILATYRQYPTQGTRLFQMLFEETFGSSTNPDTLYIDFGTYVPESSPSWAQRILGVPVPSGEGPRRTSLIPAGRSRPSSGNILQKLIQPVAGQVSKQSENLASIISGNAPLASRPRPATYNDFLTNLYDTSMKPRDVYAEINKWGEELGYIHPDTPPERPARKTLKDLVATQEAERLAELRRKSEEVLPTPGGIEDLMSGEDVASYMRRLMSRFNPLDAISKQMGPNMGVPDSDKLTAPTSTRLPPSVRNEEGAEITQAADYILDQLEKDNRNLSRLALRWQIRPKESSLTSTVMGQTAYGAWITDMYEWYPELARSFGPYKRSIYESMMERLRLRLNKSGRGIQTYHNIPSDEMTMPTEYGP